MSSTTTTTENDNDHTKYSLNLVYHPGKEIVLADMLSRAFLQDDDDPLEENFEGQHLIYNTNV